LVIFINSLVAWHSWKKMSDEEPAVFKRKACRPTPVGEMDSSRICIIHFRNCTEAKVQSLSNSQMETTCNAAANRQKQSNPDTRFDDLRAPIPADFIQDVHGSTREVQQEVYQRFQIA
jgi:hypothetical protein